MVLAGLGIRRERVPITSVARTDAPLVFEAGPASCNQNPHVKVHETATTVTLTAARDRSFCGGVGDCQDIVEFRLDEPLGDRRLIDGDTGEQLGLLPSRF